MFHSLHPERISGFIRRDRGSQPHLRPLPAGLQQCHPDSTLGEQKSDQSHHLKIKTDSHNQRHKSYRGTCCTVTTATGHGGGGVIIGSLRLAVGGVVQRFSLVGCSVLWEKVVCWFSVYLDLMEAVIVEWWERLLIWQPGVWQETCIMQLLTEIIM